METEILTPKSEIDDYQTPHDFLEFENNCISNNEIQESNNESYIDSTSENAPSTTQEIFEILNDDKISCEEVKFEDHNTKLEERLKELKEQMLTLKDELVEEKVAWQKELEEVNKVAKAISVNYSNDNQVPTSYVSNMELVPKYNYSDIDVESLASEPTLSELTILDYEQKLQSYQEALAKAQLEKRNMLKRQLAANAYKRRLLEVEKLCNMELMKVKQSVQYLQPLQALASSWDGSQSENIMRFDDELTGIVSKTQNDPKPPSQIGDENNVKSDFMTVEDFENTVFKDLKEFSSQIAATPCVLKSITDTDDFGNTVLMNNWYNNELGPHSPFNPLM